MRRVLVTGCAGFIGSHLSDALLDAGHEVVGADDLSGGYRDNVPARDHFHFWQTDITDLDAMTQACRGCEIVYHCAALAYEGLSVFSPALVVNNIVTGSVTVMTAAIRAGVTRFINSSSMARYGSADAPFHEWTNPKPADPYGLAKWTAERQLTLLGDSHGIKVVHVVPHSVAGARQVYSDPYRNAAAIMLNRMLQGKQPIIYGDGEQVRCFSFIQDVIPTLLQMMDAPIPHGEVYNVGPDEHPISINQLAKRCAKAVGFPDLHPIHVDPRPCEVKVAWCSSDKIRQRFGYRTKTTIDEGLAEMAAYIRGRGVRPFHYALPIEIVSDKTPRTWTEQLL